MLVDFDGRTIAMEEVLERQRWRIRIGASEDISISETAPEGKGIISMDAECS